MSQTRVIFCSDVHLCHQQWCGRTSEQRMDRMIGQLNAHYEERPYEKLVFLGDYSLDYWKWDVKGSWLERGVSESQRFARDYASRLKAPYYMLPGNHEQYGEALWQQLVGMPRKDYFVVGGYLIICCDNFAGELDPVEHSDGVYSVTDLDFVRKAMAQHPDLPVILCAHYFDIEDKEPEAFYTFLKEEKRITLLICGHDHIVEITDLGEQAGHVCLYHDGQFSYAGGRQSPVDNMWGFCEAVLTDKGVEMVYIEPENDIKVGGKPYHHDYTEKCRKFFPRRDL